MASPKAVLVANKKPIPYNNFAVYDQENDIDPGTTARAYQDC